MRTLLSYLGLPYISAMPVRHRGGSCKQKYAQLSRRGKGEARLLSGLGTLARSLKGRRLPGMHAQLRLLQQPMQLHAHTLLVACPSGNAAEPIHAWQSVTRYMAGSEKPCSYTSMTKPKDLTPESLLLSHIICRIIMAAILGFNKELCRSLGYFGHAVVLVRARCEE